MVNIMTGIPFNTPKRLHHREDEGALEFPSSVGSRARGLLALKACNWRAASGGGWKNPYITDGLVAMWDGEWNVGGGLPHDATTGTWRDISGNGFDLTMMVGERTSWGDMYVENDVYAEGQVQCSAFLDDDQKSSEIAGKIMTIEAVVSDWFRGERIVVTPNKYRHLGYIGAITIGVGNFGGTATLPNSHDVSMVSVCYEGPPSTDVTRNDRVYKNGGRVAWENRWGTDFSNAKFSVMGSYGFDHRICYGRMYGLRIYSRALSDTEVAENYAVDKARFGLT